MTLKCIDKLALLLGRLFSSQNHFLVLASDENTKIIYKSYSVEEEMYLTFNQILYYSKGEPAMARSILENIYMIYMISDESAQGQVTDFFYYAYQTCYDALESDLDRQKLQDMVKPVRPQQYCHQRRSIHRARPARVASRIRRFLPGERIQPAR